MTVREVLVEGSATLVAASDTPGLDASLLLAEVLNVSRSSLIAADNRPLDESVLTAFRALIKRRLAGECVAYIVGRKEFYGLDFQVNPAVLVPRPDTETLVEAALDVIREWGLGSRQLAKTNQSVRVLDLCTGSGAVAIALKHAVPELEVWASDISAEALEVAQANAARLLPPDSIHFCHDDLFDDSSFPIPHSSFLIITSNPPYIPTAEIAGLSPEVQREPFLALDGGSDGLGVIGRIIHRAPQFLCAANQGFGGILLLEADPRQMERIAVLLRQAGFTDMRTRRDLSGRERVIGGKFRR